MLAEMSQERMLNSDSATIKAKPEHHKFLIGRQGVNIQTVHDKTGAKIIFPSEKDVDREVITILGSKEAVEAAKKELESRIRDLDKIVEETMTVDPKHHRTILEFVKDNSITCEVVDENKVKFRDKVTSLSDAADIVLRDMGYDWAAVQGALWWSHKGKSLKDLRYERES